MGYCPEEFCNDAKTNFSCNTELDLNIGLESCNNSFIDIVVFHNFSAVTEILVDQMLLDKLKKCYVSEHWTQTSCIQCLIQVHKVIKTK